ncbi:microtubule-associated protein 9 [Periophthalmus magnuspinnatus]|uniref:microtubule-associated protein 9 n=1 Tax=Periophthalmus magnuspinnatus TaxID=409849 RepID=UPI0024373CCD|nr:microtubule-associated protein 9 [Periophthalmus magnuspinnatus]
MSDQDWETLAHTRSPKTTTRTKFQDELQAAVSARASRVIMDQYSGDFDEEEDEFFNKLLNSRKKKANAFKTRKPKTVNFEFSDEEDKPVTTKRVSFLKTQRTPPEGDLTQEKNNNDTSLSQSVDCSGDNSFSKQRSDIESSQSQDTPENTNRSASPLSADALQDTPPLLPPEVCQDAAPQAEGPKKEQPTPKPRQRFMPVPNDPQDQQRNEPSNQHNASSSSPNLSEETHAALSSRSQSLSSAGELTKSTPDSGSKNGFNSQDGENHCVSFEELALSQPQPSSGNSLDQTDCPTNAYSDIPDDPSDTISASRAKSPRSGSAKKVESKYLGSLRVLDRTFSLHDTETQADSLRAAVYQEWVKKKKTSLKQSIEIKKTEERVKVKKKEEQEAQREHAIACYEAWKEKKSESLKVKTKEQQERIRKEQRAREEKEEKSQASKQVFEKWKHQRDLLLKEKHRKARKHETEEKLQKQEKEEERKKANYSAFTEWNEKKKNVLHERAAVTRKELEENAKAERCLKEEKDKMALDMYESWLKRKNIEKKRHKEEKWFQGILHDGSTPPPWSPPNKTIPRGK